MSFSEGVSNSTLAGNISSHNSTAGGNRMEWGSPSVMSVVIFTLTFLLGVPGNSAVIWVFGFKVKSKVHTVCFLNLAVADLIYCLTLPFRMANMFLSFSGDTDYFSNNFLGTLMLLNASASIYLLCLISIYRCLGIIRPIWFQQHVSRTWVHAACFGVWILVFIMWLPLLLLQDLEEESAVLESIWFVFSFGIPLVIIITCYSLVGWRLQRDRFVKSKKSFRLIVSVVITFIICWTPSTICDLLSTFTTSIPEDWTILTAALASFNSALNPLLYVVVGRKFRQVIRRSLHASLRLAFAQQRLELEARTRNHTSCPTI
ncbi:C3a anaphylatoxin chemotactic receptor-like [Hypanus sabinus]|uniref:C3a anaphylatoxin chemotactic receptor-like n=1 Tax=Hypanus sabinus TaxID=79690 RepID=UPI0028C43F9A|nr:C3a anaphylatoxin chemotactic receptor-like [Hypanus sabinus]